MEQAASNELIYNVAEASEYLKIGKSTLRKMVAQHTITSRRFGKLIKFTKDDLDKWIESRKIDIVDFSYLNNL